MSASPGPARAFDEPPSEPEIPLAGGAANQGQVVRVGDTVRRPARAWSSATHALLDHLEGVGFAGAPRFLGFDAAGREVLSYVEGDVAVAPVPNWARQPEAAESVAALLREYHRAVSSFEWGNFPDWDSHVLSPWSDGSLLCHNDVVRSNVVFREGQAVALIDFDRAAPATDEYEVALAIQQWIPLRGEDDPANVAASRTAERIRRFCDAYGLHARGRAALLEIILASESAGLQELAELVRKGHPAYVALWHGGAPERIRQRLDWIGANADVLADALC